MLIQDVEKFYEYQLKKMRNLEHELAKTIKVVKALECIVEPGSLSYANGEPATIIGGSKRSIEKMVLEIGAQPGHNIFSLNDMCEWIAAYYQREVNANAVSTALWRIRKDGLGVVNKVGHGKHELVMTGDQNG